MNPSDQHIELFHGTDLSGAGSIVEHGFVPLGDVDSSFAEIAAEFGHDPAGIRKTLENMCRFSVIEADRGRGVWFTPNRVTAWDWASRSPELRSEVLEAVWLIENGMGDDPFRDPAGWFNNPKCCAFVLEGLWEHDPAVVSARIPVRMLNEGDRMALRSEMREIWPEVRIEGPVGAENVLGFETRSRRVWTSAAAGLLGISSDELMQLIEDEEIERPDPPEEPGQLSSWSLERFAQMTGIGPARLFNRFSEFGIDPKL